jgi:hypothetical protein
LEIYFSPWIRWFLRALGMILVVNSRHAGQRAGLGL